MFLLKQGVLQVYLEANGTIIAVMNDGAYFGEVALINKRRRGASVKSLTYSIVFSLDEKDFTKMLERHPAVREVIFKESETRAPPPPPLLRAARPRPTEYPRRASD